MVDFGSVWDVTPDGDYLGIDRPHVQNCHCLTLFALDVAHRRGFAASHAGMGRAGYPGGVSHSLLSNNPHRLAIVAGVYYTRLKNTGHFNTLVGNVRPTAKQSRVIHPTVRVIDFALMYLTLRSQQNRIITIREQARAQGFPDWFRFRGTLQERTQQIGMSIALRKITACSSGVANAVPVTLGEAIGRSLYQAILRDYERDPSSLFRA
jgi:site-specific DNA-cytosine methylase